MNSGLKNGIIFTTGLILGCGGGILATWQYFKKRYQAIADEEIAEMKDYYEEIINYQNNGCEMANDTAEVNPIDDENGDRSQGVLSDSARDEIKNKLLRNYEETTNYANIYKEKQAEAENPVEEDDEPNPIDELNEAEIATAEHLEHFGEPARIISVEEYDALPAHIDTQTLYFYNSDETVVDDNDEEIVDPSTFVGNCLDGFIDSEESMIFVYNPSIDTAYEIQRVDGAYRATGIL